ncbi:MAG: nitroreductase family protein [Gammaproteobacteria bacterium]
MELIDVIRTTNACRYYKTDAVSDAIVIEVLDAARWAPTGSNKQPVTWVVVRDAAKRRALHDLYQPLWDGIMEKYSSGAIGAGFRPGFLEHVDHFAKHLKDVPVMLVVCAAVNEITPVDANLGRLSVTGGSSIYPAVQNLMLAARNEGLGTTLTTILCLAEAEVKALLDIPDELATCAMIALGWPARPFPTRLHRKPLADIVFLDSYGTPLPGA